MPPKFKGEVPLKLEDGRAFTLTFSNGTLFEAELAYGRPMHVLLSHLQGDMWGAVRAFLFASIAPKHPEVTLEQCGDMLLGGSIATIGKSILAGLEDALPAQAEGKKGANPPRRGRAGKTAGGSGAKPASTPKGSGKQRRARPR